MNRPKIILDTNICSDVVNGVISPDEWKRVRQHINAHYRYWISFITLKELCGRLAKGKDEFFEENKKPLRVLYEPAKIEFLAYPVTFALRTVLGVDVSRRFDRKYARTEEEFYELIYKVVLRASSKRQLKVLGVPNPNSRPKIITFDLDHFDSHEDGPQKTFAERFKKIREGKVKNPTPRMIVEGLLEDLPSDCVRTGDIPTPTAENYEKLEHSLDAACKHICNVAGLMKDGNYDISKPKNENNWGDSMQLFYLCDESMHFLTADKGFHNNTQGSPQQSRILLYKDFVQSF
jgi:hypothetical protein